MSQPKQEMAYTIQELARMSVHLKKKYLIGRTQDRESPKPFWYSANHNLDTVIFSARDVNSFWLVYETRDDDPLLRV